MKLSHSISHATHSRRTSSNVLAHAPHHPRREQSLKIPRLESLSERRRGFYPVSLEVTEEHIARMTYFFNEAPMCDCTTQNAIALAIRPLVEDRHRVSISLKKGEAVAQVGDSTCVLGKAIGHWLEKAFTGAPVATFRQTIWLPLGCLLRSTPLLSAFEAPLFPSA